MTHIGFFIIGAFVGMFFGVVYSRHAQALAAHRRALHRVKTDVGASRGTAIVALIIMIVVGATMYAAMGR